MIGPCKRCPVREVVTDRLREDWEPPFSPGTTRIKINDCSLENSVPPKVSRRLSQRRSFPIKGAYPSHLLEIASRTKTVLEDMVERRFTDGRRLVGRVDDRNSMFPFGTTSGVLYR